MVDNYSDTAEQDWNDHECIDDINDEETEAIVEQFYVDLKEGREVI